MAKVGIITFHFSDNYGALLQAYALRRWLIDEGHDAQFVNYVPSHVEEGGEICWPVNWLELKSNIKALFLYYSKLKRRFFLPSAAQAAFNDFISSDLAVKGPIYRSRDELEAAKLKFDLLICGSDQIWNPSIQHGLDPVYFLGFEPNGAKRISYAPSFGSCDLAPAYTSTASMLLTQLDAISVREAGAVGLVKKLCGRDVSCVPDPTFLLSDYSSLIDQKPKLRNTIFAFILRSSVGFSPILGALSKKLNAVVSNGYNPHRRWSEVGSTVYGGPREWLSALNAADIVVTNSFHATVFSILLRKKFVALRLPGSRRPLSQRLEHLLAEVGLSERLLEPGDVSGASRLCDTPIDWAKVSIEINRLRDTGVKYLRASIS